MSSTAATIIPATESNLRLAGERLRAGGLVAFPTETVYGLGANALDERAVLSIFAAKGRPLTDPRIVHVPSTEKALELLLLDDEARELFTFLAARFWPGPLTMVARAVDRIPLKVSAGTGFVGVRRPAHDVAQRMLAEAGVPVAAPSANRFGHVSPTSAQHVVADLGAHPIAVLDGGDSCAVGIESTVMKIDLGHEPPRVLLFRRGGVSQRQLERALREGGYGHVRVDVVSRAAGDDEAGLESPGQLLVHYAPDVVTYLVRHKRGHRRVDGGAVAAAQAADATGAVPAPALLVDGGGTLDVSRAAVLDFGGALACQGLRHGCLAYRDLSPDGNVSAAARGLFEGLRWGESVEGVKLVLLADVPSLAGDHEHADAVGDRMFRAASGRYCRLVPASAPLAVGAMASAKDGAPAAAAAAE